MINLILFLLNSGQFEYLAHMNVNGASSIGMSNVVNKMDLKLHFIYNIKRVSLDTLIVDFVTKSVDFLINNGRGWTKIHALDSLKNKPIKGVFINKLFYPEKVSKNILVDFYSSYYNFLPDSSLKEEGKEFKRNEGDSLNFHNERIIIKKLYTEFGEKMALILKIDSTSIVSTNLMNGRELRTNTISIDSNTVKYSVDRKIVLSSNIKGIMIRKGIIDKDTFSTKVLKTTTLELVE